MLRLPRAASLRDDRPVDMLRRSEMLRDMLDRSRKHPLIADEAASDDEQPKQVTRDPAAVELGRRGGLRGGPARAAKLSPERRSEIARKAARARWDAR